MEGENKASVDGVGRDIVKVEGRGRGRGGGRCNDMVVRIVGLGLTLVAAVVAGVNKETQTIPFTIVDTLPPLYVPVTAKWNYLSSSVYFVVSNAIACSYIAVSLILSKVAGSGKNGAITLGLLISDLIMMALLFSANGAATAVGIIALNGNSHLQWHRVCNVFETYCHKGAASIVMSMLGSCVLLWLVVLATLNLHKKF